MIGLQRYLQIIQLLTKLKMQLTELQKMCSLLWVKPNHTLVHLFEESFIDIRDEYVVKIILNLMIAVYRCNHPWWSTNLLVFSLQNSQGHSSSSGAQLTSLDDLHKALEIARLLVFLCEHDRTGFAGCTRSSPLTGWRAMTEDFSQIQCHTATEFVFWWLTLKVRMKCNCVQIINLELMQNW